MRKWFTFTTQPGADVNNPNNYGNPQDTQPFCPGNVKLCAIFAEVDGFGFPIISSQLITDIANALQSGSESSTVLLRF